MCASVLEASVRLLQELDRELHTGIYEERARGNTPQATGEIVELRKRAQTLKLLEIATRKAYYLLQLKMLGDEDSFLVGYALLDYVSLRAETHPEAWYHAVKALVRLRKLVEGKDLSQAKEKAGRILEDAAIEAANWAAKSFGNISTP
jgi:hypothetical protein